MLTKAESGPCGSCVRTHDAVDSRLQRISFLALQFSREVDRLAPIELEVPPILPLEEGVRHGCARFDFEPLEWFGRSLDARLGSA